MPVDLYSFKLHKRYPFVLDDPLSGKLKAVSSVELYSPLIVFKRPEMILTLLTDCVTEQSRAYTAALECRLNIELHNFCSVYAQYSFYNIIVVNESFSERSRTFFRVPLKTALKRENEIAASDTRKADEAGLAPG